jgi:hypothetical protein
MTAIAIGSNKLDFGRVVSRTLDVLRRNLGPFAVLAAIWFGLPILVSDLLRLNPFGLPAGKALGGSANLLCGLLSLAGYGALVHGAIADLRGRRTPTRELFTQAAPMIARLFGANLLLTLGVLLGLILLVVPGLVLATRWAVVLPLMVVERSKGVSAAFARSAALTSGSRWRSLGLGLLYFTGLIASVALVSTIEGLSGAGTNPSGGPFSPVDLLLPIIDGAIMGAVQLVGAVLSAVLYFELREMRDGPDSSSLASVFD